MSPPPEVIGYRRAAALQGIEVLDAYHSPREWQLISPSYGISFLRTWQGQGRHLGQAADLKPGMVFCNYPDEPIVGAPAPGEPRSFHSLIVAPDVLRSWVAESQPRLLRAEWKALFPVASQSLLERFKAFSEALRPGVSDLELQSSAAELAERLIAELLVGAVDVPTSQPPIARSAMRMRECLEEEGLDVDLDTLAERARLDRFQALRTFKKHFGLPPYAYQLRLRITRARVLLLEGASAVEVASRCGFADQSHMIRHFKRIVGVTPSQYVHCALHRALDPGALRDAEGFDGEGRAG